MALLPYSSHEPLEWLDDGDLTRAIGFAPMLDMESGFSLEKLVLDDEICGMAVRLRAAHAAEEEGGIVALVEELVRDGYVLIADHTLRHLPRPDAQPARVALT